MYVKRVFKPEEIELMKELYTKYKLSLTEISYRFSCKEKYVQEIFNNLRLPHNPPKQYVPLNADYFEVIDTQEKAYNLGLYFAIGNCKVKTGKNKDVVRFMVNDGELPVLLHLMQLFGGKISIHYNDSKWFFDVRNFQFHDALAKYSWVTLADINHELYYSILRGYKDGEEYLDKERKLTKKEKSIIDSILS